ncbi:double homeobox B [Nannospalax galili]|uniref:Double homeobox B-like 1 n=1 Tax=Nannospalax galili TaxID=1026970 RepID=A0A8C6QJU9_NANGA|nr:double homeobox B [Nannospalax galili]XP_029410326.1 double homeobox B [Nannospalax galili]
MDLSCTSNGLLEKEARRRRIILNQNQKDTLCASFEKNPNPDLATRGHLAKELGISESQIMTWFQKHRKIQKQLEFECCLEECEVQGQDRPKAKEAGRTRTHFTRFQTDILIEAFEKNRFPGIATREKLSKQTGIPESRIHIWFQNRRARHPGPRHGTHTTAQLSQSSQGPALNSAGHFAPSNTLTSTCSLGPAFSPPQESSSPLDLSRGPPRQLLRTTMLQPSQNVLGGDDAHTSSTLTGHLSTVITLGEEDVYTQAPIWLLIQGKGQDLSENSGLAVLPLGDSTQAPPANQLLQDLNQKDIPAFLQCWDEWFQSMLAEWMPDKEYWSPEQLEIHSCQMKV